MNRFAVLLWGAAAALMVDAASASEWHALGKSGQDDIYVDRASIREHGGAVDAWVLYDYAETRMSPDSDKPFRSGKGLKRFRCRDKTVGTLQFMLFPEKHARGQKVDAIRFQPAKVEDRRVEPGSVNERLLNYVCKRAAGKGSR